MRQLQLSNTMTILNNLYQNDLIQALDQVQMIVHFDHQGSVLHANSLFLATMGYAQDEVIGQHHRIFCKEENTDAAQQNQFWNETEQSGTLSGEFYRFKKNGEAICLQGAYVNVKESQGGIEKSLGLFTTGQWLSIPFIFVGIVFIFLAEKPLPKDLFKDSDPNKLF